MVIGGTVGTCGGFVFGVQAGSKWAGVIGGMIGALVGGAVGFSFPQQGAIAGGIVGAFVGGAFGGGVGKTIKNPNSSSREKLLAMAKGAGIGAATGFIAGTIGTGVADT